MDKVEVRGVKYLARYIGDGVYALFDGQGIWLHANDHANPTDRIYLEPEVVSSLKRYFEDITTSLEVWKKRLQE